MITIDQASGSQGFEPLRTLAHYRRNATGRILFGIHAALSGKELQAEFVLSVGDIVDIQKIKNSTT